MEILLDIMVDLVGALLESAADKTAEKHGKGKAIAYLVCVLLVFFSVLILGIHWVTTGRVIPGILAIALAVFILTVFIIGAFRARQE